MQSNTTFQDEDRMTLAPLDVPIFARTLDPPIEKIYAPTETLTAIVRGCQVTVKRPPEGAVSISIEPPGGYGKGVFFAIYAPSVAALETLGDVPAICAAVAAGLRALGYDDLRSAWDQKFYGPRVPSVEGAA